MVAPNTLSDEDYQLSEVNQLGTPLTVYRLKPGSIRLLRLNSLLSISLGFIILIFTLSQTPHFPSVTLLPAWIMGLYVLFQGGIMYVLKIRQAQSTRVIICKAGLFQVKKMLRRTQVDEVRWSDIFTLVGSSIFYRDDRQKLRFSSLTLTSDYQHFDELLAQIAAHSEEFASEEWEKLQSGPAGTWHRPKPQPEENGKYRCPCCGYITLSQRSEYEICPVCYWQDDGQDDLDAGFNRLIGPNHMSLELGRENYRKFGATQQRALELVREPRQDEM